MSNPQTRKSCVVPMCLNTTINAPKKLFFVVPFETKSRKKWMQVMRRADPPSAKSNVYCCEDHFDIESDMENYVKYKLVGGRITLKKGIVPHKFECQKPIYETPESFVVHKQNDFQKLLYDDSIPPTSDIPQERFVTFCNENDVMENSLGDNNIQSLEKFINHIAVQVNLNNKVSHKATITGEKYFEELEMNKKSTTQCKELIDIVSICNFTDTSSKYVYEKDSASSDSDKTEYERVFFKQ